MIYLFTVMEHYHGYTGSPLLALIAEDDELAFRSLIFQNP
jgi:hypothetical protein